MTNNGIILYKTSEWQIKVLLESENIWMTQTQIWELFWKSQKTISEHINNIYEDWELRQALTMRKISNSGYSGIGFNKYFII